MSTETKKYIKETSSHTFSNKGALFFFFFFQIDLLRLLLPVIFYSKQLWSISCEAYVGGSTLLLFDSGNEGSVNSICFHDHDHEVCLKDTSVFINHLSPAASNRT